MFFRVGIIVKNTYFTCFYFLFAFSEYFTDLSTTSWLLKSYRDLQLTQKLVLLMMNWSIVQFWLCLLQHLTIHFSVIWWSLRGMEQFFCIYTIGTMSAVSYNNTLKDGLVLGQNTNNFWDMFHPSAPSLITLHCFSQLHSSGCFNVLWWSLHCQS